MKAITRAWSDATWEVHVRGMEKYYGPDLQREPPMVADKLPGYHVYSWRLPEQFQPSRMALAASQLWYFATILIGDVVHPLIRRFKGHDWQPDGTASPDCGYMGALR